MRRQAMLATNDVTYRDLSSGTSRTSWLSHSVREQDKCYHAALTNSLNSPDLSGGGEGPASTVLDFKA